MQISFRNAVQSDNVITELNKNKGEGELVEMLGKGRCFPNELRRDVGSRGKNHSQGSFTPSVGAKRSQRAYPANQNKAKKGV